MESVPLVQARLHDRADELPNAQLSATEEIVSFVVLVPDEFTLDFDHHNVIIVIACDGARRPNLDSLNQRQFLSNIDRLAH